MSRHPVSRSSSEWRSPYEERMCALSRDGDTWLTGGQFLRYAMEKQEIKPAKMAECLGIDLATLKRNLRIQLIDSPICTKLAALSGMDRFDGTEYWKASIHNASDAATVAFDMTRNVADEPMLGNLGVRCNDPSFRERGAALQAAAIREAQAMIGRS